jgi:hypothetical protein
MADRTSAEIFSTVIIRIAAEPQSGARDALIRDIYTQARVYDFHPCQMDPDAYDALAALGLVEPANYEE